MGLIVAPKTVLGYVQHYAVAMPNNIATMTPIETTTTAFVPNEAVTGKMAFIASTQHQRVKYDLGLGKNPSLAQRKNRMIADATTATTQFIAPQFRSQSIQEAAQNWFDYEAVRDFPAPRLSNQAGIAPPALSRPTNSENAHKQQQQAASSSKAGEAITAAVKKPSKSFPPLKPQRSASDVLRIQRLKQQRQHDVHSTENSLPFMSRIASTDQKHQQHHDTQNIQLDPNTAWVEMLLFQQLEQQEMATAMAMV
jgi:hypothetical protein